MKVIYNSLFSALLLILVGCGSPTDKTPIDKNPPISVSVSSVATESNSPFLSASGKIEAVNSVSLSTRIMGFVDKIHIKVGEKVKKGQLLVSINNTDLSAKRAQTNAGIAEAQAAFSSAEKDYQRFKNLFEQNSATQKELDDQRARYEMAKARLQGAQEMRNEVQSQFAYVDLRAPFDGIITNKFIDQGDMANPGAPLVSLEGAGSFIVLAAVPEGEIAKIKSGTEVQVNVKSLSNDLRGKVTEISGSANNSGGQYLVKVVLDTIDSGLRSGMYATVRFPVERTTKSEGILVPKEALVTRGELTGIYTVGQNNTAILRWLRLGRSYGDRVEVLSGLAADEKYIVTADSKLYNGAALIIKD